MRLVLLGCPGVGKGTQAKFIQERFHIAHISTGDMLRAAIQAESPLGKQVKQILDEGGLVSDDVMIELVKSRIAENDCKNGFMLDGFPRTIPQAEALDQNHIDLDYVIEISLPDDEIIRRLSGRRVHPSSGRVYHVLYNPPKKEGVDDISGEPLVQRIDDQEDTVKKRLALYHQQTSPLIQYYQQAAEDTSKPHPHYVRILGTGSVEEVRDKIFAALSAARAAQQDSRI